MRLSKVVTLVGILGLVFSQAGCGKKKKKDQTQFGAPALAPIVAAATPPALKPTASLTLLDADSDAVGYMQNMFKATIGKISGGTGIGFVNANLEDVDTRVAGVDQQVVDSSTSCLSKAATSYSFDASSINSMLALTLNLQCNSKFQDPSNTGTSGMNFGKNGENFSVWLYLAHTGGDGFGYVANLTGAGTTDEIVDYVYLENSSSEYSRLSGMRLKAKPSTKTFELVYASTQSNAIADNVALGCGFSMISDGSLIYAKGLEIPAGGGSDCANALSFEACVSATDLSTSAAGACDTLKTTFTMTGDLRSTDFTGKADTMAKILPISAAASVTTPIED